MKKFSLATVISVAVLTFGFIACSPELPSVLDPLGITSKGSSGGGGGGSDSSSSVINTANLTTSQVSTTDTIEESVTLDLSSVKLTSAAVAAMPVGTDVTNLFKESKIVSSGASVNANIISRNILFDTSSTPATSGDGFKAEVVSISEVSLEVKITTSNPGRNCSILYTAVIPAEDTQTGKAYVDVVRKINVGDGAGEISSSSIPLTNGSIPGSIPSANDVAGKIFKVNDDSDYRIKYYKFDSNGENIDVYRYKIARGELEEDEDESYTYNAESGAFEDTSEDEDSVIDAAIGDVDYLVKVSDAYYLYNGMCLTRKSGAGLNGTFEFTENFEENLKETMDGTEMTIGTLKVSVVMTISCDENGVFVGGFNWNSNVTYSDEFKKLMTENGGDVSELEAVNESEYFDIVGSYTNNDGVITVRGSTIRTYTDKEGKVETVTDEFDNGISLYTGDKLYFGDSLEIVSQMQGQ